MKLLLLFSGLALSLSLAAQYPSNSIKSRLGYQTTGDGLVYRGSGAPAYSPGTLFNAWMYLDTTNFVLYGYIGFQWQRLPLVNNGLNADGAYHQLGGSLVENTTVETGTYAMNIGKTSGTDYAKINIFGSGLGAGLFNSYGTGGVEAEINVSGGIAEILAENVLEGGNSSIQVGKHGFYQFYLHPTLGVSYWRMDSTKFRLRGLQSYSSHAAADIDNTEYQLYKINNSRAIYLKNSTVTSQDILGAGTADRSARWTGTNALGAGSWSDNLTRLQAQVPVQFQSVTTAGLPTGVTGYTVYNTTTNGLAWYQGSRWAYGLESTFNRGTAARVPFFDANGQVTDNAGLSYGSGAFEGLFVSAASSPRIAIGTTNTAFIAVPTANTNWSTLSLVGDLVHRVSSATNRYIFDFNGTGRYVLSQNGLTHNSSGTTGAIFNYTGGGSTTINATGVSVSTPVLGGGMFVSGNSPQLNLNNGLTAGLMAIISGATNFFSDSQVGDIIFYNANTKRILFGIDNGSGTAVSVMRVASTGLGIFTAPSYALDGSGSTNAFGLPRGTVVQRPTIASSTTPIRYNTDSTALEYGESVGTWRQLATRAYARSLITGSTWLKPQLEAGSVTINAATNADLFINNLDSVKFGKTLIRSSNNGLLILNPDVGAGGISTFGAGYHTVINGILNGTDGGTGHIILGGTVTANTTGTTFAMALGYSSNVSTAYGLGVGYNADVTADNGAAFGRNALADETGEMSLGSSIYSKINLWTNTGDIFAKGDVIAEDSVKVTTRPSMTSNQLAVYDANGWLGIKEQKRDTTIYIDDADYDFSAVITTTQIASRFNRVIFWMTTTGAAGSDSEITLHTPDANLMQIEYLIHSVDEAGGFTNVIRFGTNNAVDSTNGLVSSYFPAAGQGVGIRAGLRSSVYKYRYY